VGQVTSALNATSLALSVEDGEVAGPALPTAARRRLCPPRLTSRSIDDHN
jgi:hypothetical protein